MNEKDYLQLVPVRGCPLPVSNNRSCCSVLIYQRPNSRTTGSRPSWHYGHALSHTTASFVPASCPLVDQKLHRNAIKGDIIPASSLSVLVQIYLHRVPLTDLDSAGLAPSARGTRYQEVSRARPDFQDWPLLAALWNGKGRCLRSRYTMQKRS